MPDYLTNLWETTYMPHGHCYFWEPYIMWSHAISDSIIALAYFIIPVSLIKIVRRRDDFTYMWMLVLFAIFIFGCGATHVFDVINIWEPMYKLDSAVRIITALASIGTATLLIKITPKLILFPSAQRWQEMNQELRDLNEQLEFKVAERTRNYQEIASEYKFLTDSIPQIVWIADPKGKPVYLNKTWFAYTQLSEEISLQEGWLKVVHPEDQPMMDYRWNLSIQKGEPFEMELRLLNYKGDYRWHLTRSLPMRNEKGEITRWLGTSTDTHDQKVEHQTLVRTNEELDNFVYIASHDLKTPINNIEGLLNIMKHRVSPESEKQLAPLWSMMEKSISQLQMTINDLADISQLQQETSKEDLQQIPIRELVDEFKVNHNALMKETSARIEMHLQTPEFYMSRKHLRSILDNLLSNALKYRASGRLPRIKISTTETHKNYILEVNDNGIGIKPEHHKRIFDMFRRFSRQTEGTGVGLNIVQRIVEKYGGSIQVESEPEQGANFRVILPKPYENV